MTKKAGFRIDAVRPGSIGARMGLEAGDRLISINGEKVPDIIAYRYLTAEENLEVEIMKPSGERWVLEIEKDYDEDLGLEFDAATFDGVRRCRNKCLFCFVDQMPPGLRPSLYLKDDDYRYSFLHGNFITLTNLQAEDWERICRWRISPLYISVHTTNPALRARLLGNSRAALILKQLKKLKRAGIEFHAQIVLCPGINDGGELDKTLEDLKHFYPALRSIAVVPVGLTAHRENLFPLRRYTPQEAQEVVRQVEGWQRRFRRRWGVNLVYAADEFYLLGGLDLPPASAYDGFPQEENGVGLTRIFVDGFYLQMRKLPRGLFLRRRAVVVTGELAAPVLQGLLTMLRRRVQGLEVRVVSLRNSFFGPQVTVAGLLTGQDLLCGLRAAQVDPEEVVFIPEVMLKKEEGIFLDGWRVEDLSSHLGRQIVVVPADGRELVKALVGREKVE
ncbi:MAG: DUF512 domain-containing protein [Moorellaceae bacterium]